MKGICPVCNGNKILPLTEKEKSYTWNKNKTHRACDNCGGQTMFGVATGEVNLRENGEPCKHEYTGVTLRNCYHRYTCKHCNYKFDIDSGD